MGITFTLNTLFNFFLIVVFAALDTRAQSILLHLYILLFTVFNGWDNSNTVKILKKRHFYNVQDICAYRCHLFCVFYVFYITTPKCMCIENPLFFYYIISSYLFCQKFLRGRGSTPFYINLTAACRVLYSITFTMFSLKSTWTVAPISAHISWACSSIETKVHQALAITNGLYMK